jgi:hypothetical protein
MLFLKNMTIVQNTLSQTRIPKVVGSIPTVARHIFQACPVWIYTQSNITEKFHRPVFVLGGKTFLNRYILERLKYHRSGLWVRVWPFCLPFLLTSACLPVISTHFPTVNHGLRLHVKDKRVRLFSVYYSWAV